jgi:hypothetical protein
MGKAPNCPNFVQSGEKNEAFCLLRTGKHEKDNFSKRWEYKGIEEESNRHEVSLTGF